MNDTKEKLLPGTALPYNENDKKAFTRIELLISAAGGLGLSQVCAITGLEGSTIQNWVKRGWVTNPRGKKYDEHQIARILIINALKECLKLESIAQLMSYVNGKTDDQSDDIINESELFNYLCQALRELEYAEDFSQNGVEAIVDEIIAEYIPPNQETRIKLRKALTVMIYACVCTDVKRRTETMLEEILTTPETTEAEREKKSEEESKTEERAVVMTTGTTDERSTNSRPWFFKKG